MRTAPSRGFTFVSFLLLVGVLAAIWWCIGFGPAYIDYVSVKGDLREAANLCMREPNDNSIRRFILKRMSQYPGIAVSENDVQIDRDPNHYVRIDVAYQRTVHPLFSNERTVAFTRHVEQDLTPVKW
jgi:hypothetical protein